MNFLELGLSPKTVQAIDEFGITEPTTVQAVSYTHLTLPTILLV